MRPTAQIYLDLLTHSHWSIARTSLIIFDECHHVQKNDPYRQIMDEYRHCAPGLRPRVLGLTASPIWDARNPGKALAALEAKLDAQVVSKSNLQACVGFNDPYRHRFSLSLYNFSKPVLFILLYPSQDPLS